jgi:small subunit ribosomal protein S1
MSEEQKTEQSQQDDEKPVTERDDASVSGHHLPTAPPDPRTDLDAKLEAEIEAAMGDMSLEDMLDEADKPRPPAGAPAGRETKTGTIVSIHGDDVFVEFGPKSQGVSSISHFTEPPKLGERMEFIVDRFDKAERLLILSRKGSIQKAEWESLEVGQTVEARCTGVNKGGLELEVANHRAFMPAGQVDIRHIPDLSVFVGEKLPCEVVEVDKQRSRIILSRKSVLETDRAEARLRLLAVLEVGQTFPAVITSLQPYGAFADLGGIDGLIHISDISHQRINHPSEVLTVGEQVQVQVLKIDETKDPPRIGLGLKQTEADPYEKGVSAINEGDTVTGKVTKLMAFGAFVELAPGVEGLIHISELSHERVHNVSKVVKPGENVTVKVLSIDPAQRRIALSIKQLRDQPSKEDFKRPEDPELRKLKAQLSKKFGELKGGIG